jgi:hypothetical protein
MNSGASDYMKGGSFERVIPTVHKDALTPFKTDAERAIKGSIRADQKKMKEKFYPTPIPETPPQQSINLSIPMGQAPAPQPIKEIIYPPKAVPIVNGMNPFSNNTINQWDYDPKGLNVNKKYNITMNGVGNISFANHLFQDVLPTQQIKQNRMTTLSERNILYNYIRSILVKRGDGEEIPTTGSKKQPELINLLSYMKVLDINPYHFSRITDNIYETLPDRFVMFNSCYPIRYDNESRNIGCATDRIGSNIRVYSMNAYDAMADALDHDGIKKKYSDLWRELQYYQYIREEILKKKLCPHFVYLYSYYITRNSGIDFDKIKNIKSSPVDKNLTYEENNKIIRLSLFNNAVSKMISMNDDGMILKAVKKGDIVAVKEPTPSEVIAKEKLTFDNLKRDARLIFGDNGNKVTIDYNGPETELVSAQRYKGIDLSSTSSKCVVAVTESPTENIIEWSTKTYSLDEIAGPIKTQVKTGVHSVKVWKNILFQLFVAFYVMDMKQITIRNMEWGKNVFIKTLDGGANKGFWKYKIGGVDFYIPNMGYLVLIDTGYDDIDGGYKNPLDDAHMEYKIVGDIYEDTEPTILYGCRDVALAHNNVSQELKHNYESLFSQNVFTGEFARYGGSRPPDEIISLMEKMSDMPYGDAEFDFKEAFLVLFDDFIHNKVGDIVTEHEKPQLHDAGADIDRAKRGNLVGVKYNHSHNAYTWGLFIESNKTEDGVTPDGTCTVLMNDLSYSDGETHLTLQTGIDSVLISRVYGKIDQKFKPTQGINSEDELLETYVLSY